MMESWMDREAYPAMDLWVKKGLGAVKLTASVNPKSYMRFITMNIFCQLHYNLIHHLLKSTGA